MAVVDVAGKLRKKLRVKIESIVTRVTSIQAFALASETEHRPKGYGDWNVNAK